MLSEVFNIRPLPESQPGEEIRRQNRLDRQGKKILPRRKSERLRDEQAGQRGQDQGVSRYA